MSTERSGARRASRPARQRGQALAEALVACVALVPLVLLTVLLGKYQSVQRATIDASRHLAFECTVRYVACRDVGANPRLADEIRIAHFAATGLGVASDDALADPPGVDERQALWVDRAGRPLLERFADVGVRVDGVAFDAGESVATGSGRRLFSQAAEILSDLAGPGRFGLEIAGGLLDARVQASLSPSSTHADFIAALDAIPLRMTARTAVLTDAWNASGPYGADVTTVESRVERGRRLPDLVEAGLDAAYALTRGLMVVADTLLMEPRASAFRYHEIDVDLVPADRLAP